MEQNIYVLVVEALTTNILPTNEVTLPTFTCSATATMKIIIIHEVAKYCSNECFPPRKLPYPIYTTACSLIAIHFGTSTEASTLRCFHYNYDHWTSPRIRSIGYGVSVNRYLIMKKYHHEKTMLTLWHVFFSRSDS